MNTKVSAGEEMVRTIQRLGRLFIQREREALKVTAALGRHGQPVIHVLGEEGPMTMGVLARTIGLSLSSMTEIIDALEQEGYVMRDRSTADRRVIHLRLTTKGRRVYRQGHDALVRFANTALATLSRNEQTVLLSLYRKIAERIHETTTSSNTKAL